MSLNIRFQKNLRNYSHDIMVGFGVPIYDDNPDCDRFHFIPGDFTNETIKVFKHAIHFYNMSDDVRQKILTITGCKYYLLFRDNDFQFHSEDIIIEGFYAYPGDEKHSIFVLDKYFRAVMYMSKNTIKHVFMPRSATNFINASGMLFHDPSRLIQMRS